MGMDIHLENTDFMKRAISELEEKGIGEKPLKDIGKTMGKALGTFAPEKTGKLKKAYDIVIGKDEVYVTWDGPKAQKLKYVKYQYYGIAMSPVFPVFDEDEEGNSADRTDMWRTKRGVKKHLAKDKHEIGVHKEFVIEKGKNKGKTAIIKGYTTEGSKNHWIEEARKTPEVYNPMRREVYEKLADAIGERIVGKRYYT